MPSLLSKRAPGTPLALDDGVITRTRPASLDDHGHVQDLHTRCSPTSRANRYGTGRAGPTSSEWQRLLTGPCNRVLLTTLDGAADRVIAMTTLVQIPDQPDVCEVSVLIADRPPNMCQSLGLGTQLARHAASLATAAGFTELSATVAATNWRALRIVETLGGPILPQTAHLSTMALLGALRVPDPTPADEVDLRINLRGAR
ncbi:GNAT family N-acetyltransferase [Streptomyces sp. NPDC051572]|uniref:GNAT family N-acetyltransferase n=1 Tax=Streptomyces sp. NPDC051572 TaxID=3155802 RepID=UPI00344D7818